MIIITGATGFIGRRVVKEIIKVYPKNQIICLIWQKDSPLETSGRKILNSLGLKTIMIDIVSGFGLNQLKKIQPINLIIHLAANTETGEKDHSSNDIGTRNLINSISPLSKNAHFIYVSTTALMGGRNNAHLPFDETTPPSPTDEYSRSKLRAEKILEKKANKDGFRLTIARLGTVYGKGYRKGSLFDFLKELINKNSPLARLNWPGLTALIHAEDVAIALTRLSRRPPKPGQSNLFILYAESLNLAQISQLMHQAMGKAYRPIILPNFLWQFTSKTRPIIYKTEPILPSNIYNLFWRATLIVENVIYSNSGKAFKALPNWKVKRLKDRVTEVI